MIPAQNAKVVNVTPAAAIKDNAAFTTNEIDTAGFDYCTIYVALGATDIAMAALKVQESDTSGSGFADVSGLDADGDTNTDGSAATLPTATDDDGVFIFQIDLRGRKRYLDLSATAGNGTNGTFMSAIALLTRGSNTPVTAAEMNALDVLRV